MLKIIGVGFIILGFNIRKYVNKEFYDLNNMIKNEKIYIYHSDIFNSGQKQLSMQTNSIVKIPRNLIDDKYSIGIIKLNKISPKLSTIVKCDKYGRIKIINNNEITNEIIQTHMLFPTKIFKEFELDQMMFMNKEIKLLVDNTKIYKSNKNENKNVIDRYRTIISNNDIEYSGLHFVYPSTFYINYELKENFITHNNDVYLMVNPCTRYMNTKLQIIAIADNKDKIVREKYSSTINKLEGQYIISFFAIAFGIGLLFVKL